MLISFYTPDSWWGAHRFSPRPAWGTPMIIGDFQSKLRKIDSRLYVKTDECANHAGFRISGIYLSNKKRVGIRNKNDKNLVHHKHETYLNAIERGELDTFICGVALEHVPEYDIFDFALNKMVIPGWRKIVLSLVKQKVCTLEKARKAFSCSSLGETDYDRMGFFARIEWAKKLSGN